jgi:membrane-associated PAP2 superfamily phosphatase
MQARNIPLPQLLGPKSIWGVIAVLGAAALLILWTGRYSDVDLVLADAVFDRAKGSFPWQHAWLTETFNHVILKCLLILVALGFVGCALVDAIRPFARFGALARMRIRVVALSAVLVPLVISSLKQVSTSHCPWDLTRYGGNQAYVRIFDVLPAGASPGHCLPAGHASSALWLLSLAVFWLPVRTRAAQAIAAAGMLFGMSVGYLQQLRGAHFLTHTLWSMWIAGVIVLATIVILQPARNKSQGAAMPDRPAARRILASESDEDDGDAIS